MKDSLQVEAGVQPESETRLTRRSENGRPSKRAQADCKDVDRPSRPIPIGYRLWRDDRLAAALDRKIARGHFLP